MTWTNDDGLIVGFGTERAKKRLVGAVNDGSEMNKLVAELDWSRLDDVAVGTEQVLDIYPGAYLPSGALIKSATLHVTEAFVGATATLTIGLIQQDHSTAIDADGIDAAIAVTAIDAIGDEIACDGALIGTILSADGYLTATVGTAAFTAGSAKLVIEYFVPKSV